MHTRYIVRFAVLDNDKRVIGYRVIKSYVNRRVAIRYAEDYDYRKIGINEHLQVVDNDTKMILFEQI